MSGWTKTWFVMFVVYLSISLWNAFTRDYVWMIAFAALAWYCLDQTMHSHAKDRRR